MVSSTFVLALVILAELSANYSHAHRAYGAIRILPDQLEKAIGIVTYTTHEGKIYFIGKQAYGLLEGIGNDDWPTECKGKYYCSAETPTYKSLRTTFENLLKDEVSHQVLGKETDERDSVDNDVARCKDNPNFEQITMIRDKHNVTWYVPQIANYTVFVETIECENGDRITPYSSSLDRHELRTKKVYCVEQRVNFNFPVLSQDKTRIELLSPYKGLPMSCSAKIIK